jgi:hypothetical protein
VQRNIGLILRQDSNKLVRLRVFAPVTAFHANCCSDLEVSYQIVRAD